ncbi:MAG: hypothetical protein HY260_12265 [Chloroflexi bacterium]|nr:hypothetical protein [Chloroflexota bacterium]
MPRGHWATILASLGGLAFAAVCIGLLFLLSRDYDPARYPGATRIGGGRLKIFSLTQGYVSQDGAYQTTDDFPTVWRWYAERFDLGANRVVNAMENCMSLAKADYQIFTRHVIGVTLCSKKDGTMIFINRTVFMHR